MLYQNESIDKICLNQYLTKLFGDINNSMGNWKHKLTITGDEASLLLHNAVPVGLLFNELFTNAIKHGFHDKNEGEIFINIKNNDSKTHFEIIESGSSFPEELNFENSVSTGLTLIKTFTEQLKGDIKLLKQPQTRFSLILNLS